MTLNVRRIATYATGRPTYRSKSCSRLLATASREKVCYLCVYCMSTYYFLFSNSKFILRPAPYSRLFTCIHDLTSTTHNLHSHNVNIWRFFNRLSGFLERKSHQQKDFPKEKDSEQLQIDQPRKLCCLFHQQNQIPPAVDDTYF